MSRVHLALIPRDGLFLNDGRGWHSSIMRRGHTLDWPFPTSLRGSLRTAWGRSLEGSRGGAPLDRAGWLRETREVTLGATIALRREIGKPWCRAHRAWPAPADALFFKGRPEAVALHPRRPEVPTLGRDEDGAREALWRPVVDSKEKPEKGPAWWTEGDFSRWLAGEAVNRPGPGHLSLEKRLQFHVGLDRATLTAMEGRLYSDEILETLAPGPAEWAIGISGKIPGTQQAIEGAPFTLGGDARIARPEPIEEGMFMPPESLLEKLQGSLGMRLVAVSPCEFAGGWLPDGFRASGDEYRGILPGIEEDLVLKAAVVGRPLPVSGWDMAAGAPKPTRRLVPPGSVYFVQKASGSPFATGEAQRLWLLALGSGTDDGLGRFVPGTWTPS